ncbi:hypothetical protein MUO56_02810 [Candidatus Bathyarchaeota archaeon]|nr:hypothetical protein [Candidatus Bathyarchaeota archaeon]
MVVVTGVGLPVLIDNVTLVPEYGTGLLLVLLSSVVLVTIMVRMKKS